MEKKKANSILTYLLVFLLGGCAFSSLSSESSIISDIKDMITITTNDSSSSIIENSSESNSIVIDYSNVSMACLGDSITLGARVENPYPSLLQGNLGMKRVYNFGVSGSTIVNNGDTPMCLRYKDMPNTLDIIMVMGGTNDYWGGYNLGTINDTLNTSFYGALKELITKLQNKYEDTFIFFTTPYQMKNGYNENTRGYVLEDYVNAIIEVCDMYDMPLLDLYHNGGIENNYELYTFDGVHPTQVFYEEYVYPQISNFLKENYK